jgi:hypothetical protein
MTAPPDLAPTPTPDLAGNQEGGLRSLRAEAETFVALHALRLSGSRQRKLIAEYVRTGGAVERMAFRSWLQKRGDLLVVRSKPQQPWRLHS